MMWRVVMVAVILGLIVLLGCCWVLAVPGG